MCCFFISDLHGHIDRYEKLFGVIIAENPGIVLLGGDLLPHMSSSGLGQDPFPSRFLPEYLLPSFRKLRDRLGERFPTVVLILGNDDPRCEEETFLAASREGLWRYVHGQKTTVAGFHFYGYACVPPTPFLLKDWERYDVSRYIPPGCVSPEEGRRTVPVSQQEIKWGTIQKDLAELAGDAALDRAIFLLHTPPHDTPLDHAALDGMMYEYVPLDVHVGSIAVRRFIEERQPRVTLHGHVHEAARISGEWKTQIGRTVCINAAHDGPELALVRFDPETPAEATRELL